MRPPAGFLFFLTLVLLSFNDLFICTQARVIVQRDASPGVLATASWIWAADSSGAASTAPGTVAFLKNIITPASQTAASAVITLTGVANFTLWVNGQAIGGSTYSEGGWKTAAVLRAALNASANVFSVLVDAGAPQPGLLAAIEVSYTDASKSTFVSDASWLAASNIPASFPNPATLSGFTPATVAAPYDSGPWGTSVALPAPDPSPLALANSTWIWSTPIAAIIADAGTVGFRKNVPTPAGKTAQSATILLTVDNAFQLYLNGLYIGAPPTSVDDVAWKYAQQFTDVPLNANENIFNVIAQNSPSTSTNTPGTASGSAAGFIAAIKVNYNDGSSDIVPTDSSWLTSSSVLSPPAFLAADDAQLVPASALGPLGISPWGQLSGVSDVLSAARVPAAPFISLKATSTNTNPNTNTSNTDANPIKTNSSGGTSATTSPQLGANLAKTHPAIPLWAIIAAAAGGGVLLLVLLLTLIICCRRRRRRAQAADKENAARVVTTNVVFTSSSASVHGKFDDYPKFEDRYGAEAVVREEPPLVLSDSAPQVSQAPIQFDGRYGAAGEVEARVTPFVLSNPAPPAQLPAKFDNRYGAGVGVGVGVGVVRARRGPLPAPPPPSYVVLEEDLEQQQSYVVEEEPEDPKLEERSVSDVSAHEPVMLADSQAPLPPPLPMALQPANGRFSPGPPPREKTPTGGDAGVPRSVRALYR
ncbi:hypothetical protein DFH06DRAFT_1295231 [Mycena polygramma]|nr:hypothetical protein DFH06DRAFT_1295231 [Mycena polygramma]